MGQANCKVKGCENYPIRIRGYIDNVGKKSSFREKYKITNTIKYYSFYGSAPIESFHDYCESHTCFYNYLNDPDLLTISDSLTFQCLRSTSADVDGCRKHKCQADGCHNVRLNSIQYCNTHYVEYTKQIQTKQITDNDIELNGITCKLCMETPINVALKCGHTGCGGCLMKLKECPYCRGTMKDIRRIYI